MDITWNGRISHAAGIYILFIKYGCLPRSSTYFALSCVLSCVYLLVANILFDFILSVSLLSNVETCDTATAHAASSSTHYIYIYSHYYYCCYSLRWESRAPLLYTYSSRIVYFAFVFPTSTCIYRSRHCMSFFLYIKYLYID